MARLPSWRCPGNGDPGSCARVGEAETQLLDWLLWRFPGAPTVLEVGCGTGHVMRWLRRRFPCAVGLDRLLAMLGEARRTTPRLPVLLADTIALPFADRRIDVIAFVTVLECLQDPVPARREAVQVARQGLALVVPNR